MLVFLALFSGPLAALAVVWYASANALPLGLLWLIPVGATLLGQLPLNMKPTPSSGTYGELIGNYSEGTFTGLGYIIGLLLSIFLTTLLLVLFPTYSIGAVIALTVMAMGLFGGAVVAATR